MNVWKQAMCRSCVPTVDQMVAGRDAVGEFLVICRVGSGKSILLLFFLKAAVGGQYRSSEPWRHTSDKKTSRG